MISPIIKGPPQLITIRHVVESKSTIYMIKSIILLSSALYKNPATIPLYARMILGHCPISTLPVA